MPLFTQILCVGMHFRPAEAKDVLSLMEYPCEVQLEREPENAYDGYAIKVLYAGTHIGYVERSQAAWIAPLLDEGQTAIATATHTVQRGKNVHPVMDIEVS